MLCSPGPRATGWRWLRASRQQWRPPRHRVEPRGCPRSHSGVATWAGAGRAHAFPCCQTWDCGAGLVAPAMAAEEEAAVRGEAAGGRPQVGARRRTRGGRPWPGCRASARRRIARWHTLLGAPLRLGIVSVWLQSEGRPLGHRCGSAARESSQGEGNGERRPQSPPAFTLPVAGCFFFLFVCSFFCRPVLGKVSWRGTIHPPCDGEQLPSTDH